MNLPYLTSLASKPSSDFRELLHCVYILLRKMKVSTAASTRAHDPALANWVLPQGGSIIVVPAALSLLVLANFPVCNSPSLPLIL